MHETKTWDSCHTAPVVVEGGEVGWDSYHTTPVVVEGGEGIIAKALLPDCSTQLKI